MSSSHHGSPHPENNREMSELLRRFCDQVDKRAKRQYTHGRLSSDDEGSLAMAIAADHRNKIVRIDFGKSVEWLGLPPQEAVALAKLLISKAREISSEPITIDV